MSFYQELFLYGVGGFGLVLAVTVGLGGFLIYKVYKKD